MQSVREFIDLCRLCLLRPKLELISSNCYNSWLRVSTRKVLTPCWHQNPCCIVPVSWPLSTFGRIAKAIMYPPLHPLSPTRTVDVRRLALNRKWQWLHVMRLHEPIVLFANAKALLFRVVYVIQHSSTTRHRHTNCQGRCLSLERWRSRLHMLHHFLSEVASTLVLVDQAFRECRDVMADRQATAAHTCGRQTRGVCISLLEQAQVALMLLPWKHKHKPTTCHILPERRRLLSILPPDGSVIEDMWSTASNNHAAIPAKWIACR